MLPHEKSCLGDAVLSAQKRNLALIVVDAEYSPDRCIIDVAEHELLRRDSRDSRTIASDYPVGRANEDQIFQLFVGNVLPWRSASRSIPWR